MATIELEIFALNDDVTAEQFLARDETFQMWSYRSRPGLLRRTLARSTTDESYMVESWWTDDHAAENELSAETSELIEWRQCWQPQSYRRRLFRTVS